MKKIYAFDVDGTLTQPRQPIDQAFETFFQSFASENTVYLITGSDRPKIEEQLPGQTMSLCAGVFTCSGAELWRGDDLVYRKSHTFPEGLFQAAEYFIDTSPYPLRCGNHIERRPGMLNISVVGRDASTAQRKAYHEWEKNHNERKAFIESLLAEFPRYEASAGGEISIDIVPAGWTKAVARGEIEKRHPGCSILFMGDKMGPEGNDRPLALELAQFPQHQSIAVSGWLDTWAELVAEKQKTAA